MKKLSREEVQEKQKVTQQKMKETRLEDAIFVRDLVNSKLKDMKENKSQIVEIISNLEKTLKQRKEQSTRIDGAIHILSELSTAPAPKETPKE